MSSSDVHHSIAGYYFQLLLACKELVKLLVNPNCAADSYVAVEKGSDIRVWTGQDICMEAKFYKGETSFTKEHNAIRHTIYNCYQHFKKAKKGNLKLTDNYIFKTNVVIGQRDEAFFRNWPNGSSGQHDEYIIFVKNCIVRDAIKHGDAQKNFQHFKSTHPLTKKDAKEGEYLKRLFEYLEQHPKEYEKYADPDELLDDKDLADFIFSIEFQFGAVNKSKRDSIQSLKKEITQLLLDFDDSLDSDSCTKINNLIVETFFDTTVSKAKDLITLQELKQLIKDHHKYQCEFLEKELMQNYLKDLEYKLEMYQKVLRRTLSEEDVERQIDLLQNLMEKLLAEMDLYSLDEVQRRFIMKHHSAAPAEVMELLKVISEVIYSVERDLGQVHFSKHKLRGINNLSLTQDQQYCFKGTNTRESQDWEDILLTEFVKDVHEKNQLGQVLGNETVLFEVTCSPCDLQEKDIRNILSDIARVDENYHIQEIFLPLKYRCTKCLRLNSSKQDCKFLQTFKREVEHVASIGTEASN